MDRKELLFEILSLRRQATGDYHKYLATAREYYPGEMMYMREVHIVLEIGEEGLDNVSVLSECLKITNGAVSQYLAKLEKKGFIVRIQDLKDKRQFSVRLTDKGKELYHQHVEYDRVNYDRASTLFTDFTNEELERICRFEERFKEFTEYLKDLK
ncbi:MAG: transcriptional regulator [Lachnospiraceae bacterium]